MNKKIDKKLTIDDLFNEDGELEIDTKNSKVHQAKVFSETVDQYAERNQPSKKGMYAGETDREEFVNLYRKSVANRKKSKPWNYPSRKALDDEIMKYFEFCVERRIPVTVAGLATWLGISVTTLGNWRRHPDKYPHYDIVDNAVAFIHAMTEQGAVDGNVPTATYSFISRNYHGLKDQMEYTVARDDVLSISDKDKIINELPDVDNKR